MTKVKLKFVEAGGRLVLAIPKPLINSGLLKLELNKEYEVEIKDSESSKIQDLQEELALLKQKFLNRDTIPTNAKTGIWTQNS